MSLLRLIYYSAIVGGWAAFVGWLAWSVSFTKDTREGSLFGVVMAGAIVGAAIGAGLNLVAGMANAQWKQQLKRAVPGLLAGGIGGALGGALGNVLYASIGLPRAFGWMVMG